MNIICFYSFDRVAHGHMNHSVGPSPLFRPPLRWSLLFQTKITQPHPLFRTEIQKACLLKIN